MKPARNKLNKQVRLPGGITISMASFGFSCTCHAAGKASRIGAHGPRFSLDVREALELELKGARNA